MHERLGIPAPLLGFGDPATVSGRTTAGTSCNASPPLASAPRA
jgi:hypothetical protein